MRLEPLDESWLDEVAAPAADPHVRRFTRIPEPPPVNFARGWINRYVTARSSIGILIPCSRATSIARA